MFNIGDRVKIDDGVVGATLIKRGVVYTVSGIHNTGSGPFRYNDKHGPYLSFDEFDGKRFPYHNFILIEAAHSVSLDEDLFII